MDSQPQKKLTNYFEDIWLTGSVSGVHLSPVNDSFVGMSATCCVMLTYMI